MNERADPLGRRHKVIFEDVAEQARCQAPLVALQAKQDRRLVRKILVQRTDADAGALGDSRHGETLRALAFQNLNSGIEHCRNERIGASLLRRLARGNIVVSRHGEVRSGQCE